MRTRLAFFLTVTLAGPVHAQCPVSSGTWTGQVGQQHVAFRVTSSGMVVDSVAVSLVGVCLQSQYSATDKTPVVPLQCSPWGFEWFHCRPDPPSNKGFRLAVQFDAFAHGTASIEFLSMGCSTSNSTCTVADFVDVTPVAPEPPPHPVITCQYSGAGTIQYGVSNGGSGVHFDVDAARFGPISIDATPLDLTGAADTASFPVSCTAAGRTAVTLAVHSNGALVDVSELCFECGGAGQTPVEVSCSAGGPSKSIQWQQTYPGPSRWGGTTVCQTADGGFALAGDGDGGTTFSLIRTKPEGDVLWERTYSIAGHTLWFRDMEPTGDGGFVLAGRISAPGESGDAFLMKVDAAGDTTWTRSYGNASTPEIARAVSLTSDGGYILAGNVSFGSPAYDDLFYVKTDASGFAQWTRSHDAGDLEVAHDVLQTRDGGYVLAGYTTGVGAGGYDAYLVKTDAAGTVLWQRTYGGALGDWARSVQETSDGGLVLAGATGAFGSGAWDFFLVRTKSDGTELWATNYGGSADDEDATVVREAANGGYMLAGTRATFIQPNVYELSTYVVFTSVTGDTIWTETFNDPAAGDDIDIALTSDGGAVVLMPVQLGPGSTGVVLVKHGPSVPTAVTEGPPGAARIALSAFPNPFNPSTTIVFRGADPARPRLTIHDAAGRLVRVLGPGIRIPSGRMWTFDARGVPSGIYTASVNADRGKISRKLVLVK